MRRILAVVALALAACGGGGGGGEPATVATPTFSPAAGTYGTVQNVTITCATAGAAIHYTLDGTVPTAASTTYSAAIPVTATATTIKAMATAAGQTDSAVASATYVLQAATPVISPAAGTYATAQEVTITSATPGAGIHFSTDGSAPTVASTLYSGAIPLPLGEVAATTTVKAIATADGFVSSAVASSTFTIDPAATPAVAPTFAPPAGAYSAVQAVVISTTTAGASVYYTADGSTPTTGSTLYTAPVPVGASLTLKAIASGGGHAASPVASAAYVITLPPAATPTFSPAAGSYTSAQSVTISSTDLGATIYYTADGTTPTTGSTVYSAPVLVNASKTLKAIATAPGHTTSAVGSATYVINTGGGTPFLTLCNGLFDKVTSLVETCMKVNPALVSTLIGSSAFCADRQKEITAGKIVYSPAAGATCNAAIQALDCTALFGQGGFAVPPSCQASLVGQVALGGVCYDSADCTTGYCGWDLNAGTCPDTCRPFIQAGGACDGAGCADGLVCDGPFGAQTCKTPSAASGACPCLDGLWCDNTSTCRAFLATGASCTVNGIPCNAQATCAGTPGTCQAWLGVGATCDVNADRCGLGYVCSAGTNTCVSWPGVGASCADTFACVNAYCDFTLTNPVCKAMVADGGTCNPSLFGTDCVSGSCNGGTLRCDASGLLECAMP
jgi:hypothetical protein